MANQTTPEQFMSQLTDMLYVEHFDNDTWKKPCDTQVLSHNVSSAMRILVRHMERAHSDSGG